MLCVGIAWARAFVDRPLRAQAGGAGVSNVVRRTWDKEEYAAKAASRALGEISNEEAERLLALNKRSGDTTFVSARTDAGLGLDRIIGQRKARGGGGGACHLPAASGVTARRARRTSRT